MLALQRMVTKVGNATLLTNATTALVGENDTLRFDPAAPAERPVQVCHQGRFIEQSIQQLRETALWGGGLAVMILFLFLLKYRYSRNPILIGTMHLRSFSRAYVMC